MENTFVSDKYGIIKYFHVGQKVQCGYYHEYERWYMKNAYKRTLISRLIDKPFKPVKLGIIVGNAGIHPYWLGIDNKEQYLYVKFKEYILPKPVPISCIEDALESAKRTSAMLERDKDKIGIVKGYDIKSRNWLKEQANKALKF